jgi:hypothetical protein
MKLAGWKAIAAAAAVVGAAFTVGTGSAAASAGPPAIQFADLGGIWDWRANGDHGIWVQAVNRQWYYGVFAGTCLGLNQAQRVGFLFGPAGQFDRWSSIIVPRQSRCYLRSFEPSGGPPGSRTRLG